MRVYFLSYIQAILKLNGMFIGGIDGFERYIELDPADRVFAEIIPDENLQGLNFYLDKQFFASPPKFCDLYLADGDAVVYIREFQPKNGKIEVLFQTRFASNVITLFEHVGVHLSIDGTQCSITALPQSFKDAKTSILTLGGREIFVVSDNRSAVIISDTGKIIYKNAASEISCADTLKICADFETCTAAKSECEYTFDGEKLIRVSARTIETRPPEREIVHFAFFESVMTSGDSAKYLDDSLKPKANELKSYLGDFVAVTVPTQKFYLTHGNLNAAGLVYPKSENLYEIKYFAVQLSSDKISNIFPVE